MNQPVHAELPRQSDCEGMLERSQQKRVARATPKFPLGRDHYIPLVLVPLVPKLVRVRP